MKRKTIMTFLVLMITTMLASPVIAVAPTITQTNAYGMDYTEIAGTLDDADYVIRIPEVWNGELVVACPWYPAEHNCQLRWNTISLYLVAAGYAFASSDYGADGFPIQKGMIRIHQLTEYVIDNYHVTGKVFVMGGSMGGAIALLLGEKYPNLYSGVLDLCGTKDVTISYNGATFAAGLTLDQIKARFGLSDADALALKNFCASISIDIKAETGGTPDTKPAAYERISPVDNAGIQIPVISIVGQLDILVPVSQHIMYQTAVTEAGRSNSYRMYIVQGVGHLAPQIFAQVPIRLVELETMSDSSS